MKIFGGGEGNNEKHQPLRDQHNEDKTEPLDSPSSYKSEDVDYPPNPVPKMRTFDEDNNTKNHDDDEESLAPPSLQGATNDVEKGTKTGYSGAEDDHLERERQKARKKYGNLLLLSNLLFVIASALYMTMAIEDMIWGKEAKSIPEEVLVADDDVSWNDYYLEQRQEGGGNDSNVAWTKESSTSAATTTERNGSGRHRHRQLLLYDTYYWAELPEDAREAAEDLGYNEILWNTGGYVADMDKFWDELKGRQKRAAEVLGWTQETWDGTATPAPSEQLTQQQQQQQQETVIPELPYDNVDWKDLEDDIREAAEKLGYDENSWNDDLPPRLVIEDNPSFDELSKKERESAILIGYDQETWWYIRRNYDNFNIPIVEEEEQEQEQEEQEQEEEQEEEEEQVEEQEEATTKPQQPQAPSDPQSNNGSSGGGDDEAQQSQTGSSSSSSSPSSSAAATPDWDEYDWQELPPAEQEAFVTLGWNEEMWTNGGSADTEELGWGELSTAQQASATFLGYNQAIWDGTTEATTAEEEGEEGEQDAETLTPTTDATSATTSIEWEQYDWDELEEAAQLAYKILGYNRDLWNEGGASSASDKKWEDLTLTERSAAISLGYTEDIWNGTEGTTTTPVPESEQPTGSSNDNTESILGGETSTVSVAETTTTTTTQYPDAEWYDYDWNGLPVEIQAAYEELGYDQAKWDNGELAYTENFSWLELTPYQQQAAQLLGYNQKLWDGTEVITATGTATGSSTSVSGTETEALWDDDYVFLVKSRNVWVSKYQILYFSAAFAFVLVGIVDLYRERSFLHINMLLAGLFGVVAAMLMEKDQIASAACGLISVHLYLLEGLLVVRYRLKRQNHEGLNNDDDDFSSPDTSIYSDLWWIPTVEIAADVFFVTGAFMDVILSYFYFEQSSDWNLALARVFGFASLLWLACSLMYTYVTLVLYFGLCSSCRPERPHSVEVHGK